MAPMVILHHVAVLYPTAHSTIGFEPDIVRHTHSIHSPRNLYALLCQYACMTLATEVTPTITCVNTS